MKPDQVKSLTGGSGVHVWLVLWKAARAVEAFAENSISRLKICGSDFAVLEALLHKGPLPVNEIGRNPYQAFEDYRLGRMGVIGA
jgi:hypothetical protein